MTFCREHLALQQVLAPGLSEYRAYISSHLVEPLYLLAKKRWERAFTHLPCFEDSFFLPRYVAGDITLAQLNETMEEVAKHLLIIIEIWGPYR